MLTKIQGKIVMRVMPFQMPVKPSGAGFRVDPQETRPVFLLTFVDGTQRVLKAEMTDQSGNEGADFIASLQSMLGADLGVALLGAADVTALAEMNKDIVFDARGRHPHAVVVKDFIKDVAESNMFIFYTMTFVSALKSLESQAHQEKKNGDERALEKLGVVKLARRMVGEPALLPALGKVVAVDLFCGNADRFGPDGNIVNAGNILFRKNADKTYTPLGIDFFDVQGEFSKMTTALQPNQATHWPGMMLSAGKTQKLDQFAASAIASLNASFTLAMAGRAMPNDAVLGAKETNAFKAGMVEGTAELRRHLLATTRRGGRLPAGVQSRMDALGWQGWVASTAPTLRAVAPQVPPRPGTQAPRGGPHTG
jgi:hypothetical protein